MLIEKEIEEKGFKKIAENLYKKYDQLYVQLHGELKLTDFISNDELKNITNYEVYQRELEKKSSKSKEDKKESKKNETKKDIKKDIPETKKLALRGTEKDIIRLMDTKLQLDSIIEASKNKDKLGEGLLWHELIFGKGDKQIIHVEPSAELIDMLAQDMGSITTKIVEINPNVIEDPNDGSKYSTYYCIAEAKDEITGTTGIGVAEQIINFDEIKNKGRTFARTLVTRKACRNAIERLIPIPRKAMVLLIRKKLEEHYKKMKR